MVVPEHSNEDNTIPRIEIEPIPNLVKSNLLTLYYQSRSLSNQQTISVYPAANLAFSQIPLKNKQVLLPTLRPKRTEDRSSSPDIHYLSFIQWNTSLHFIMLSSREIDFLLW